MTFVEAITTCFSKYIDFSGRATRSEYWWFILFIFITMFVAGMIVQQNMSLNWIILALDLLFFLPSLAVAVRRLHDIDRSGWFILIGLIPIIGLLILIYWYVQPSTPGSNRFG